MSEQPNEKAVECGGKAPGDCLSRCRCACERMQSSPKQLLCSIIRTVWLVTFGRQG